MPSAFFSYSHVDEAYRNALEEHLAMLKRDGLIDLWHDLRIEPGEEIDSTIDKRINEDDIILLLVSPAFLNSHYCFDTEMRRAMERHETKDARVVPIILRPCDWHNAPFGKLSALPRDGRPVSNWPDRDEALLDVVRGIRRVAEGLARRHGAGNSSALPAESPSPTDSALSPKRPAPSD